MDQNVLMDEVSKRLQIFGFFVSSVDFFIEEEPPKLNRLTFASSLRSSRQVLRVIWVFKTKQQERSQHFKSKIARAVG